MTAQMNKDVDVGKEDLTAPYSCTKLAVYFFKKKSE